MDELIIKLGLEKILWRWLVRFIIVGAIFFLFFKIFLVNPVLVIVSSSFLSLLLFSINEESILVLNQKIILRKRYFFDLIKIDVVINIIDIKEIIVAGNLNKKSLLYDFLPVYFAWRSSNEIRVIFKNGDVKKISSLIYIEKLVNLENLISKPK